MKLSYDWVTIIIFTLGVGMLSLSNFLLVKSNLTSFSIEIWIQGISFLLAGMFCIGIGVRDLINIIREEKGEKNE